MFSCLRCCTKDSYTLNKAIKSTESSTESPFYRIPILQNPHSTEYDKIGKEPRYQLPNVVLPIPHENKDANNTNGHVIPIKDDISNKIQAPEDSVVVIDERITDEQVIQPVKDVRTDHKDASNNIHKEQKQKEQIQPLTDNIIDILNSTQRSTPKISIDPPDDKHAEVDTQENKNKSIIEPVETILPKNNTLTHVDNGSEDRLVDMQPPIDQESNQDPAIQNITLENQPAPMKIDVEVEIENVDLVQDNDQSIRIDTKVEVEDIDVSASQNTTPVHVRIYVPPIVEEKTQEPKQSEAEMEQPQTNPEVRFTEPIDAGPANEESSEKILEKHASFSPVLETIQPDDQVSESDVDEGSITTPRTSEELDLQEVDVNNVNKPDKKREGVRQPVNIDHDLEINIHPKSEDDKLCIKNAIAANEFLENILKENNLDDVIDAMYPRELNDGDIIIEEGEPGNHLYISDHGTFEVYIANKLVNTFTDKRVFGELAVLYNSRRMATIKAASNGKVWVLHRKIYQQSLVKDAVKYQEETKSFLTKVPLVNQLKEDKLNKIANLLHKEFFKTGKVIIQEGDEGDKFYIIRAGSVTVTKEGEGKVAELGRGAFFGERALLYADRRQATVTADGPVECLTLTRSKFLEHFDDKILEQPGANEPQEEITRPNPVQPSGRYSDVEINNLTIVRTLGVGGFGRVELVKHKHDADLTFALKYLRKFDMVQQGQVEHVFNEKNIQIQCDSPFIVNMYKTFQDGKYLYFLMESCLGGDLWSFLQKRRNKCVPNQDARFYAACVLEALAYLHERNFIFRDLKPENLLIDSQGYLKLTDFGFAKHLGTTAKTFTFAGTPEYVAPEIIYNKGHEKSVDYWAFGVLIFELLVGRTPFRAGDDHMKTYNRILKGINSVQFPPNVGRTACSIIVKLCRATPTERLGAQKNGIADIRAHKWFQGFEWNKLRNRKLRAPFVPRLSSNIDTRYFEYFKPDTDIPPEEPTEFNAF